MKTKLYFLISLALLINLRAEGDTNIDYTEGSSADSSSCQLQKLNSEPLEEAQAFLEDFARVKINGKWGAIDSSGEWIIPAKFDFIYPFSGKEIAPARLKGLEGFIDRRGEWFIEAKFRGVQHFSEGYAATRNNAKWGWITKKGKFSFHLYPQFDAAGDFIDGMALVLLDDKWGYINKYGEYEIEQKFTNLSYFSEGLAIASIHPNGYPVGYIDKYGDFEIPPIFERARDFSNGMARVMFDGRWGHIDTEGEWIIHPTKFEYVGYFDGETGLAPAKLNGKMGYIDRIGEWVISPLFNNAEDFRGGFAAVDIGENQWSYINLRGQRISHRTFDYAWPFSDHLAVVKVDGKMGLIDTNGEWLIEPTFNRIGPIFEGLGSATFDEGLFLVQLVCSAN